MSHGHFVVRADAITSAMAAVERETFDLFICDLTLPDGCGMELLPRLRSCSREKWGTEAIPAIAISGYTFQDDIALCMASGFAAHLAKPFDEQQLLALIAEVTGRTSQQSRSESTDTVRNGGIPSPVPARLR